MSNDRITAIRTIEELCIENIVNTNSLMREELVEYGLDADGQGTLAYECAKQIHITTRKIMKELHNV
jgi:hypothetical protein